MIYTTYQLLLLFFTYSFLGWILETIVSSFKHKSFKNRGFVTGPFCYLYGFAAIIVAINLYELKTQYLFLFLGSALISTVIEWLAGKSLERMHQKRWWDYSNKRFNLEGYICLQYSILWGFLGSLSVVFINDFLLNIYLLIPGLLGKIIIVFIIVTGIIDFFGSILAIYHLDQSIPSLFRWNQRAQDLTLKFGTSISNHIDSRIQRAYPYIQEAEDRRKDPNRLKFTELFWIFTLASFIGDITETIYCRLYAGIWMSRSSLVWGPFSVVWGGALVLATILLYRNKNMEDRKIFFIGFAFGGAFEYICSVMTEILFGKVFWDYSGFKFNLGGRINLLYCFFWGIAAVIWIKGLYPYCIRFVRWIIHKTKHWITSVLILFMCINMLVSALALIRYDERSKNIKENDSIDEIMDTYYNDQIMQKIYPNAMER